MFSATMEVGIFKSNKYKFYTLKGCLDYLAIQNQANGNIQPYYSAYISDGSNTYYANVLEQFSSSSNVYLKSKSIAGTFSIKCSNINNLVSCHGCAEIQLPIEASCSATPNPPASTSNKEKVIIKLFI